MVYSTDVGQIYEPLDSVNIYIGMIIQMRIRYANGTYGPHTAIIAQKDTSGITFLESNYLGNGMVTNNRRLTYMQFYNSLETYSSYSIYYIK